MIEAGLDTTDAIPPTTAPDSTSPPVAREMDGTVAVLTLQHAPHNFLGPALIAGLLDGLRWARARHARAVLLRSGLRNICAFVHMDADSSLRESNGIVRAVAAENDNRLLAICGSTEESLDVILLFCRLASRAHIINRNAELGCQGPNSSVIVARNDMYRDTTLLQGLNRPRSVRSKLIFKTKDRL